MKQPITSSTIAREEDIFEEVARLADPGERDACLDRACAGDTALRARIERLLGVANDAFFNSPLSWEAPRGIIPMLDGFAAGAPAPESAGGRIGRYKLLERLGEGGCGVVYMAEQEEPVRRRVALKVIKLGMDTKSVIARFEAERQALALMDHPNIAKVLDGGATEAGRPYFVMELVRGVRITDYCDNANLSTADRLGIFIQVCHAIQHAHQKGVIHRDIKPSNVLVTLHDGVAVPKVIDFGIAKATTDQRLTDKTLFTALEQFIGTPAYMSPEQAEMSGLDIDTHCDIYSLGVLLYEMLTGRTPFDAKELLASGLDGMRRTIREREPVRPSNRFATLGHEELTATAKRRSVDNSRLIHQLKGDLDWVVMKCLEKDRSRRYESAGDLAADLKRHLGNEPVTARPPSVTDKMRKFVGRNQTVVAAGAALVAVLILGTVISIWQAVRATRAQQNEAKQRALAVEALARVRVQERLSRQFRYAAEMFSAFESLKSDNLRRSRELLDKQHPLHDPNEGPAQAGTDSRGWEWRHLWHRTRGDKHVELAGHSNSVAGALFLNDGKTIVSAADDDTLKLWDLGRRAHFRTIPLASVNSHTLALSPDGRWLAVGGDPWQLFDTANWERVSMGTNLAHAEGLAFSPDSRRLVFVTGLEIRVLDVDSRKLLRSIRRSGAWDGRNQVGLAFSRDGRRLAYTDPDGTVRVLNLDEKTELIVRPARQVMSVVFSHDGRFLVTAGHGGIEVWDGGAGTILQSLDGHSEEVTWVAVSPDGRLLASASVDQTVRLWETSSWKALRTLRGHELTVRSVAFSNDGRRLVTAGLDERLRVWDLDGLALHEDAFVSADNAPFSWPFAHGDHVALVHGNLPYSPASLDVPQSVRDAVRLHGDQGAVTYLNCVTLTESAPERTPPSFSSSQVMAFGFDANSVAVGWPDGRVEFWTTRPFQRVSAFTEPTNAPMHLAVAANGRRVSIHRADDTVEIWNPVKGEVELRLPELGNLFAGPNCGFWARDTIMARCSQGWRALPPLIELWFLPEGRRRVFPHPKGGLWTQAVSNDGRLLATSGWDGQLRIWDVEREQQIETIAGQLKTYYSLVFSPDDSRLVGGGYDGTITMWDVATRQQVAHWKAHDRECAWLRFVGPNQDLISLGNLNNNDRHQGDIRLWRAPSLLEIDAQKPVP